MEDVPVFKAAKKRKIARYQHHYPTEESQSSITGTGKLAGTTTDADDASDEEPSVARLIRSRNQKARRGLQFGSERGAKNSEREDETSNIMALTKSQTPAEDPLTDVSSRFTTTTGHVVDVDQHMIEYIENQMGQQRTQASLGNPRPTPPTFHEAGDFPDDEDERAIQSGDAESKRDRNQNNTKSRATIPTHNQPNHLAEVSLSSLPAAAQPKPNTKPQSRPPKKQKYVYLDRKGNPLPPRPPRSPRKRQNSTDQARDLFVEQILSENKLQESQSPLISTSTSDPNTTTTTSTTTTTTTARGMNEDADERLAAEFQREFFEGQAERKHARQSQQNHAASRKNAAGGTAGSGVPDGPKLGGSRSARAKMHAALMAEKEKAKGK